MSSTTSPTKRRRLLQGLALGAAATLTFGGLTFGAATPALADAPEYAAAEQCTPAAGAIVQDSATMTWGLKESWNRYLAMPFVGATFTPLDGATRAADGTVTYAIDAAASSYDPATKSGTIAYTGGVHYQGHHGAMSLVVKSPKIELAGDGTAVLKALVSKDGTSAQDVQEVTLANLNVTYSAEGPSEFTATATGVFANITSPSEFAAYTGQATLPVNLAFNYTPASVCSPATKLSAATAEPGDSVTVSGVHFAPNTAVSISINGVEVGAATPGADGKFEQTITVPSDAAAGAATVTIKQGNTSITEQLEITAKALPTPTVSYDKELTNLNPNGEWITVTGTNFLPNPPATTPREGRDPAAACGA